MKVIVIGYGSIGSRHASVLTELGCRVAMVSRRNIDFDLSYSSLKEVQNELIGIRARFPEAWANKE